MSLAEFCLNLFVDISPETRHFIDNTDRFRNFVFLFAKEKSSPKIICWVFLFPCVSDVCELYFLCVVYVCVYAIQKCKAFFCIF